MTEGNNFTPGKIFTTGAQNFFPSLIQNLITQMVDNFYKQIFTGEIFPRQIVEVTGDGPFPSEQLGNLVRVFGLDFYLAPEDTDWGDEGDFPPQPNSPLIVIIGRENFDEDTLQDRVTHYRQQDGDFFYTFFSQEDFFNYWLFGIEANYLPGDTRIENHPGLKCLSSFSEYPWPWPPTHPFLDTGNMGDVELNTEHILRSRYGYTVAEKRGFSEKQRQKILDGAVREDILSLQEIVEHIAYLVQSRKLMQSNNPRRNLGSAIHKWESDLSYLKRTYYRKQFKWPPTTASSW